MFEQVLLFLIGTTLTIVGIKGFKNAKIIYQKTTNMSYKTIYAKWFATRNTPIFIKISSVTVALYGMIILSFLMKDKS